MLSGFVMLMTLERTQRVGDFVVARFSRLYPAFWCGVALTFAVVSFSRLPGRVVSLEEAIGNLTMLHLHTRDVDPVYWTLKCELQFYIVMTILLACRASRFAPAVLSGLVGIHITDGFIGFTDWNGWGLWRLNSWLPMKHFYLFLVGTVFYEMRSGFRRRHALMLALAVYEAVCISLMHAWITFLLAALLFVVTRYRVRVLATRPMLFLGAISYPLYLVHQNIGYSIIRAAEARGLESHLSILLATAIAIGLAWLISTRIEQPARRWIMRCYRTGWFRQRPLIAGKMASD